MSRLRFQVLLDLHRRNEDDARRELGQRERERAVRASWLAAVRQELADAAAAPAVPRLREVQSACVLRLRAAALQAAAALAEQEARVEEARRLLAAAHRQVATFERLQARDRAEAARTARRIEARANDEFAAMRRLMGAMP